MLWGRTIVDFNTQTGEIETEPHIIFAVNMGTKLPPENHI